MPGAAEGHGWAGVVGHPIDHSLSPVLHRAAYERLGLDLDYRREDCGEERFPQYLDAARADPAWRGLSVTMPLKSAALAAADRTTAFARTVGVANTLVRAEDGGELLAHNTDVAGIVNAVLGARAGSAGSGSGSDDPETGPRAAVIGGGGTATAAVAALHVLGARSLDCWVRSEARAGRVADVARRLGLPVRYRPLGEAAEALAGYDVVVCTLPGGAFDEHAANIAGDLTGTTVLDVAYEPWPSALARGVEAHGGRVASGKEMLLHQALDQVKLFTDTPLDRTLPEQGDVLAAMAAALGLPPVGHNPVPVHAESLLRPRAAAETAVSKGSEDGRAPARDAGSVPDRAE